MDNSIDYFRLVIVKNVADADCVNFEIDPKLSLDEKYRFCSIRVENFSAQLGLIGFDDMHISLMCSVPQRNTMDNVVYNVSKCLAVLPVHTSSFTNVNVINSYQHIDFVNSSVNDKIYIPVSACNGMKWNFRITNKDMNTLAHSCDWTAVISFQFYK